jgi:hypothetical protein
MQQVLHYSALKTGTAYVALTLTTIAFSGVAQALTTRVGVRPLLPLGMIMAAGALVLYARLPVHGHYFWDLFPAFLLTGVSLALAFVPMSIGALAGVPASEAGVASGLGCVIDVREYERKFQNADDLLLDRLEGRTGLDFYRPADRPRAAVGCHPLREIPSSIEVGNRVSRTVGSRSG